MKTIPIYADIYTANQLDSALNQAGTQDYPAFFCGDDCEVTLRFNLKENGTAYALDPLATYKLSIANDFDPATAPQQRINNSGFTVIDAANGILEVLVPLSTQELIDAVDGNESVASKIQLDQFISAKSTTLLQTACKLRGDLDGDTGQSPTESDPLYRTAAEQDSIDATKVDKDFSGYGTKAALVDADTLAANDSENSGNIIVVTMTKIYNYVKAKLFPESTTTLTQGTTTYITLGDTSTYSVFRILIKIYDASGNYELMKLLCSHDGAGNALISHSGGHASASSIANFDPTLGLGVDTDINSGNQRLALTLSAGADCTALMQIQTKM